MPFLMLELFDANVNSFSKLRRMQWLSQGTMPLHFDEHHHNVHLTNGQEMVQCLHQLKRSLNLWQSNLMA
jgi:UV DNA damage repair endonuclease